MSVSGIIAIALTVAAYATGAVLGVALSVVDLRSHRLPNRLVLPLYPIGIGLLGAASLIQGRLDALGIALAGMVSLFTFYLVLRLARPAGMGGGDVKLAGALGLFLGYAGWSALLIGGLAAFVLGGIYAVGLLLTRRGAGPTAIPFGPFMVAGAVSGLLVAAPV